MFQDKKVSAVLMPDVVERADVRMVQRRDRSRLALESFAQGRIAADVRGQDLYCNGAIEAGVFRLVDLAHAPSTDGRNDLIWPEASTGTEGHWGVGSDGQILPDSMRWGNDSL